MNGTVNECFLDSSILIGYIKGTQTELLDKLFADKTENYINHIVYSEFMFHFLSVMSGRSPLTLKGASKIREIMEIHKPIEFLNNFNLLEMDEEIINKSDHFMKTYNLLPNDALILATCYSHNISYLVSYDSDFVEVCDKEGLVLIDSPQKYMEIKNSIVAEETEIQEVSEE